MSTRSSARNLFPPLDNPKLTIRRRSRANPTLLNDFEMASEGNGDLPVPDLRTMEELCQPSSNGLDGPITPIAIQETNFRLKNDMIQQVQNSCHFMSLLAVEESGVDESELAFSAAILVSEEEVIEQDDSLCNTITNPKEDLKGITTRSGTAYQGPTIPTTSSSLPNVVECETEAIKDKDLNFNISFADALILMPEFGSTIKTLLTNKDKLSELARTSLNKHCSTVLLKKLPKKLRDLGKFFILCDFSGMVECLALADLCASINHIPLSVWNKLSLPELSTTCMTIELADRSVSRPVRIAEDVFIKTGRALIDVFEGELTLRVGKEAITFNLDQTSRYSSNYNDMTANQIDVIDMDCEEYSQEVLGFSDVIASGNPTSYYDPIVSTTSLTLTPFGEKAFLNDDPSLPPPNQGNYLPQVRKELKICEAKTDKSSIDEPPEVKLKDLPPHLKYAFLEADDKLPVIIAKDLSNEEKTALIMVLKSHKRAIAWKLSDIKGIDPEFYTHKILMEDDFEPAVQHQRRVNPQIHDVIKNEVLKLLDVGLIYQISNSPWVIFKFPPIRKIKKRPHSHVLTEHLPTVTCLLGYEMHWNSIQVCEIFDVWGIDFMGPFPSSRGNRYILVAVDYLSKWVEAKVLPTNDARVVCKFLKNLFARFGTPVPLSVITERTSAMATYKTLIGCTPYKLVYEKACHLLIELEHKAYWALKHANYDLQTADDHRKVQLNELNELHDQAYKNSLIYKEKTKRLHDSKIKDRVFNIGDRVLLFNSRLKIFSGKWKTRWSGPFTISHVFPYGTVELSQTDGPNFKVNGHRLKHYFGKDIPNMAVPYL
nr:reverse transcriptase domain-containing protein [Tanacetum cinerariifolium]